MACIYLVECVDNCFLHNYTDENLLSISTLLSNIFLIDDSIENECTDRIPTVNLSTERFFVISIEYFMGGAVIIYH